MACSLNPPGVTKTMGLSSHALIPETAQLTMTWVLWEFCSFLWLFYKLYKYQLSRASGDCCGLKGQFRSKLVKKGQICYKCFSWLFSAAFLATRDSHLVFEPWSALKISGSLDLWLALWSSFRVLCQFFESALSKDLKSLPPAGSSDNNDKE